jgi:hypothetical protein
MANPFQSSKDVSQTSNNYSSGTTANNGSFANTQNPWAVQAPFLTQAFNAASGALGTANNAPAPSGFVSQFTPDQLSAFNAMLRYGTDNGAIPASSAAAGGALTGAGANAVGAGLYGLANFQPTSASDIVSNTNTFADNPYISQMIDAATRDARRAVSENALPALERNAALSGNTNSSRTGIAEGVINRGLADTVADTSANIRGQAYNTGLNAAQNLAALAQSGKLSALTGLVGGGTGAVGTGVGANTGAVGQAGGLFDIANAGIGGQQQASQAAINDALARYQFGVSSPFAPLNNYWNIIGANNWGGSTSGTTTQAGTNTNMGTGTSNASITNNPSIVGDISTLLGMGGAFAGSPFGAAAGGGLFNLASNGFRPGIY